MQKFIERLLHANREGLLVYGSLFISLMLVVLRVMYTKSPDFYLVWNVFLAFLPYLFSKRLLLLQSEQASGIKRGWWFLLWFLFIPNSAYILTDFIHLEPGSFIFWFDILMISSMAFTGIFLGSLSFYNIHAWLLHYIKREYIWPILIFFSLLTGVGVYVGRFWRWNSWDVFSQPHVLLADVSQALSTMTEMKNILFFTVAYGMFQFFVYIMLYVIKGRIYVVEREKQHLLKKPAYAELRLK